MGWGVQPFSRGGSNCLFNKETHITYVFPGGSGPLVPPSLWISACNIWINWMLWQKLDIRKSYQIWTSLSVPICKHGVWEINQRGLIRIQIICHFAGSDNFRSNHCILPFALKLENMSSSDNLCKQFGPRSGLNSVQALSGSRLFGTLKVMTS